MEKQTVALTGPEPAPARASGTHGVPGHIRELLGPAPILRWESAERYERVLGFMAQAVEPRDWIEWVWTKDLVDLGWAAERARRAQATAVGLAYNKALAHLMGGPRDSRIGSRHQAGIARLSSGDPEALRAFDEMLDGLGLTREAVGDTAYLLAMDDTERLAMVVARCDFRRDALLRDMERRRDFKLRMRAALQGLEQAVDAEFDELDGEA